MADPPDDPNLAEAITQMGGINLSKDIPPYPDKPPSTYWADVFQNFSRIPYSQQYRVISDLKASQPEPREMFEAEVKRVLTENVLLLDDADATLKGTHFGVIRKQIGLSGKPLHSKEELDAFIQNMRTQFKEPLEIAKKKLVDLGSKDPIGNLKKKGVNAMVAGDQQD